MKLHIRNDPMGWSFETFRRHEPWVADPASPSAFRLDHSDLPGLVLGGALALVGLFIASAIPAGIRDNVVAALLGVGSLILIATGIVSGRLLAGLALATAGVAGFSLAVAGIASPAWLPAAALAGAVGGWLAMRATSQATLFATWAWFHGLTAAALVTL